MKLTQNNFFNKTNLLFARRQCKLLDICENIDISIDNQDILQESKTYFILTELNSFLKHKLGAHI